MAKSVSEVIDDLRQDVARWKSEVVRLRAQGCSLSAEQMEKAIASAERMLSRWNDPMGE